MECTKTDFISSEAVIRAEPDVELRALDELQLTLVGGGCGETVPH